MSDVSPDNWLRRAIEGAELAAAAREMHLRVVIDSVPAMIMELDTEDRIRYCNRPYAEYFGIEPEKMVGMTVAQAFGVAAAERLGEQRERIRAGESVVYERTLVREGKPDAQLLVQVVPRLQQNRDYIGCYVMSEDITERKRLEKMKEEFINTVSHELRTPLSAIRASLDRIAAESLSSGASESIDVARASCERLVRLVNDILDLQRLRAGARPPGLSAVDLPKVVRAAIDANRSFAQEHDVVIDMAAAEEKLIVSAHPDRVTQLVTNLLANAVKHSAKGDKVQVSVERRFGCARVNVRDQGPGVPADFQDQLFQKFTQSAEGRKRGGTGLGLAICKAIADQMNGRVGFEPGKSSGAVFWFELPDFH